MLCAGRCPWKVTPKPLGIDREAETTCSPTSVLFSLRIGKSTWEELTRPCRHYYILRFFPPFPKSDTFMLLERIHQNDPETKMVHWKMFLSPSHSAWIEKPTSSVGMNGTLSYFPFVLSAFVRAVVLLSDLYSCYLDRRGKQGLYFTPFAEPVMDTLGSIIGNINIGWGTWVAQRLSVCLQLRSWSRGPGIEAYIGLPSGSLHPLCLCLCVSHE